MKLLMQKPGLTIPEFARHLFLAVNVDGDDGSQASLTVASVDVDGT